MRLPRLRSSLWDPREPTCRPWLPRLGNGGWNSISLRANKDWPVPGAGLTVPGREQAQHRPWAAGHRRRPRPLFGQLPGRSGPVRC